MRFRLVLIPLGLALLACTGALPTPDEGDGTEEAGPEDGDKGEKAKRKRRRRGGPGGDDGSDQPDDGGGDEVDDGDDGGGGGGGAAPSPSPSPSPAPAPAGIEQVNGTTWNVSQQKKDQILKNPGKFAGARKKGRGYALSGVKSGSDAWHLGLRNGDIVKEINGYSLASEAEAIAAYSALQDAKKLRVKLKRGEGPLNHVYNMD